MVIRDKLSSVMLSPNYFLTDTILVSVFFLPVF